jgi:hypothetical protein
MSKMKCRPSPALAVSVLALAVASAGTAGALPGKGKVKANDLAKNAVRDRAIKADAVRTRAIAPGAVGSGELADGSVSSEKLGPVSVATGPTNSFSDITAGDGVWSAASSKAECPEGTRLIAGGVQANPSAGSGSSVAFGRVQATVSFPENERTWTAAGASDNGPGVGDLTAYAMCLD